MLVAVEQGKYVNHDITEKKVDLLDEAGIELIRFNWFTDDDPNASLVKSDIGDRTLRWSEGRICLVDLALLSGADYVLYMDEDTYFETDTDRNPYVVLLEFLNEWNPAAAHINTVNIWSGDDRITERSKRGLPTVIKKHDACNSVLRRDLASLLHPIKYHGSDAVTHYQQFMCHHLRKQHYLSPPHLTAINGIEEQHNYTDDRNPSWYSEILREFRDDLVPSVAHQFDDYVAVTHAKNTDDLMNTEPLKNAPAVTEDEYTNHFK